MKSSIKSVSVRPVACITLGARRIEGRTKLLGWDWGLVGGECELR
jgi:hypothetical protein